MTCIEHPAAANETFLAGDGEDLSTTELLRRMDKALGRPARLVPVPVAVLENGAKLVGKPELSQRLCDQHAIKGVIMVSWRPARRYGVLYRDRQRSETAGIDCGGKIVGAPAACQSHG